MAGSRRAELIACACGSWKFTCHASRGAETVKLKTARLSRDHQHSSETEEMNLHRSAGPLEPLLDFSSDLGVVDAIVPQA